MKKNEVYVYYARCEQSSINTNIQKPYKWKREQEQIQTLKQKKNCSEKKIRGWKYKKKKKLPFLLAFLDERSTLFFPLQQLLARGEGDLREKRATEEYDGLTTHLKLKELSLVGQNVNYILQMSFIFNSYIFVYRDLNFFVTPKFALY